MSDAPRARRVRPVRQPDPEPIEADEVKTIAVGTLLWVAAFFVLLPFSGRLVDHGHGWWLWTCLAGAGLGLVGLGYVRRRRARPR